MLDARRRDRVARSPSATRATRRRWSGRWCPAHRGRASRTSSPTGVAAGGRVVTGGRRPRDLDRGWYFEPTVVDIDDNANPLAQTEVFGPVLTVQGYRDVDEAVAITNDSPYDLSGGVYTHDLAPGSSSPAASARAPCR